MGSSCFITHHSIMLGSTSTTYFKASKYELHVGLYVVIDQLMLNFVIIGKPCRNVEAGNLFFASLEVLWNVLDLIIRPSMENVSELNLGKES
ncbi:hypothetical protein PanWU01x14_038290 [Parasponia andersonii]|uniref:Uncharacterized protein n=1 Tax=Parasponia andersonii TaxID=3476 RepID=A0A2P5DRH1_PARAD|nr:hypothetical protein PanWU01x14_038290 [Parasponia andersonii]